MLPDDAASLRREASLCRYLGRCSDDAHVRAQLLGLAEEYETLALMLAPHEQSPSSGYPHQTRTRDPRPSI